jgi:hypothetical protein
MVTLKRGTLRLIAKESDVEMYLNAGWKIVEQANKEKELLADKVTETKQPKKNFIKITDEDYK